MLRGFFRWILPFEIAVRLFLRCRFDPPVVMWRRGRWRVILERDDFWEEEDAD